MNGSPAVALERLMRRLQLLVGIGRIQTGNDAGNVQLQQVQFNFRETQDDMPRVGEYGFASMPLPNCQAVVLFIGGERSNGAIIGTNDEAHRLKNLQPGEVAIYDDQGQSVYITRSGIVINGAGKTVSIVNAPHITHDGVNIGKDHVHGNVQSGSSSTGVPH